MSAKSHVSDDNERPPDILFNRFVVKDQLGKGSFGKVYRVIDKNSERTFAMKVEKVRTDKKGKQSQLEWEAIIYNDISGKPIGPSTSKLKWPMMWFYKSDGTNNYMVMDLLGPDLDHILSRQPKKAMPCATVAYVAQKMISLVETFHSNHYVHRDLKPQNFVFGNYPNIKKVRFPELYLIDYGLARRYVEKDNEHLAFDQDKPLMGTVRFSSINTHLGVEQTRRDDMQCLGYIFLFLLLGRLPWQNLLQNKHRKEAYHSIMLKKMSSPIELLCSQLPDVIRNPMMAYLFYVHSLKYHGPPDYAYCRKLFQKCSQRFDGYLL